ncbi:MAG: hypothetical protein J6V45_00925 [Kiritimatiellae bacterium]|nr:hypothetical protein [Kiritimatiellia bacterium]
MKMIFALFLAIILTGCATVETSDVGGRHMVVVSNSGWYLFNLIPIASGNPEKVNKVSCSLFSETATLENNYKILDDIIKSSGAKSVKSLKSFWNDESIFVILMKRHVIHTTAELVFDEDGEKK